MLKIAFTSDLHVDSEMPDVTGWPEADVLVVGGDTGNSARTLMEFIDHVEPRYERIIVVDGNHEHWCNGYDHRTIEDNLKLIRDHLPANAHLLGHGNPTVNIGDVNFVGCNGWYSGDCIGEPLDQRGRWRHDWPEYKAIGFDRIDQKLPWDRALDDADLVRKTVEGLDGKIVVVTHTVPHREMVSWRQDYSWDRNNAYFVNSHMARVIEDLGEKIEVWYNGHTHERREKTINGVYCIANPLGYRHERNGRWEPILLEL